MNLKGWSKKPEMPSAWSLNEWKGTWSGSRNSSSHAARKPAPGGGPLHDQMNREKSQPGPSIRRALMLSAEPGGTHVYAMGLACSHGDYGGLRSDQS
ncbi:hypothetical protein COMA2_80122 [Candidatus Nitrospira nitrificans]|uniref:Uncharacterized protein n=1 Tax=Candidatus Nitrospira nitrificans TaxID=1742973 RepID=A0A0S4LSX9_9BACT|nr:hypothetical protein COMA2_80122 [Candidatus Nitrospira nitrificans]